MEQSKTAFLLVDRKEKNDSLKSSWKVEVTRGKTFKNNLGLHAVIWS